MKTKRQHTVTPAHLDAALAERWNSNTCLLAQSFGGPMHLNACGTTGVLTRDPATGKLLEQIRWPSTMSDLQIKFDDLHGDNGRHMPQAEKEQRVAALRALLPKTFEIEVAPYEDNE